MDPVGDLIGSIQDQTQILYAGSLAGVAIIFSVWLSFLKIKDDVNTDRLRHPRFLFVPLFFFLFSIAAWYAIGAAVTGYRTEVLVGLDHNGVPIADPTSHYIQQYRKTIEYTAIFQIGTSALGMICFAGWLVFCVLKGANRKGRGK